jgi:hypothetical protein
VSGAERLLFHINFLGQEMAYAGAVSTEADEPMNKPVFDTTTSNQVMAPDVEREAFDIAGLRRDGVQVIKNFFEPEMRARFKALGERVVAGLKSGEYDRTVQFVLGVDLDNEARPSDSAALTAVAEELFGKDIGQFYMRLVMKDATFRVPVEAHQDWPYFGGDTNKVAVFIPLSHCGADNGMVQYYAGSHFMGPVERGEVDVVRYPQFPGVTPEMEVGDVLIADFLTWHASGESETGAPRIMIQLVLQPLSDPSSSFQFGHSPEEWGPQVMPRKTTPMRTARPSIGILTVKEMVAYPAVDEAARMCRGLCLDSRKNVEAHMLMAEIIKIKGDTGDDLLHGVSKNGTVEGLLEYAEDGLVELSKELDIALGRPSRLTAELTETMTAVLEDHQAAQALAERYLKDAQNELSESAAALWQSRHDLVAAEAQVAELSAKSTELSAVLARTQDELTRSQETLASVMASASWKLTGPLRQVVSVIKQR